MDSGVFKEQVKPEHLRIGNLVMHEGKIVEVLNVDKSQMMVYDELIDRFWVTRIDFLSPIPLDATILEKAGFETVELPANFNGGRSGWQILIMPSAKRYLLLSGTGLFWLTCVYDSNNVYNMQSLGDVGHLHQLQNLYWCLVGEELNIEL